MDLSIGQEIVLSSDLEDPAVNSAAWNPLTGNKITRFRGPASGRNCLAVVGDDYVISAVVNKPFLHVWTWSMNERTENKYVLPGVASALAVSPCSYYCAIAISKKIYIYFISTGDLYNVVGYHSSDICILKFTEDGRFLISAGTVDPRVFVWSFHGLISISADKKDTMPFKTFTDHSDQITDVHVTSVGHSTKVASCGEDCRCFVYDLKSGEKMFSVFGNVYFTSVTMDPAEFYLYIGTRQGDILQVKFHEFLSQSSEQLQMMQTFAAGVDPQNQQQQQGISLDASDERGVKKWESDPGAAITCLSVSLDGRLLASGSSNGKARIWDTLHGKSDINFVHKGAVSNVFFVVAPYALLSSEKFEPNMVFAPLKRSIHTDDDINDLVPMKLSSAVPLTFGLDPYTKILNTMYAQGQCLESARSKTGVEEELEKCRVINEQFYSFTLGTYLNSLKGDLCQP